MNPNVLLLTARRSRPKGIGFMPGWALALAAIDVATVLVDGQVSMSPDTSDAVLASWRNWLQVNWRMLMFWQFVGIGAYVAVKSIIELAHSATGGTA